MPLSLLVIDCDDFKEINDRAGHEFGDALLQEVADVLSRSLPEGAEAARLGGDEFVVMFPGAGSDLAEALGAPDPNAPGGGSHRRGFPAQNLRRRLDVPLRRCDTDVAPPRGRPGAVCGQGGGEGSRRIVPRALPVHCPPVPAQRRAGRSRVVGAEGLTDPAPFSLTRWPRRRRSRPRARSKASAVGCARPSSSSSARPRAPRRASSATTSSTPPTMRSARCRSATRRPTGSPTSLSPPRCCGAVSRRRSRSPKVTSIRSEAFVLRELGMNALLMLPMQRTRQCVGARRAVRDAPSALQRRGRRRRRVPRGAGREATGGRGRHRRRPQPPRRLRAAGRRGLSTAYAADEIGAPPAVAG